MDSKENKEQLFGYSGKLNEFANDQMRGTAQQIKLFLRRRKVGYEFWKGPVIPFFDIDKYYSTQEEQEEDWERSINAYYAILDKEYSAYPQRHIYVLDSSGYKEHKKGNWINSFHFKIRGVGYHKCGNGVRPVAERLGFKVDMNVYKHEDAWVKFRLPYATKDIDHPRFARIVHRGKDGEWYELDLDKAEEQIVRGKKDCYANWLVQNVEGEKCLDGEEVEAKVEVKREVVKAETLPDTAHLLETSAESLMALNDYPVDPEFLVFEQIPAAGIPAEVYEFPKEKLRALVMLLSPKRADDYEEWFRVICAIQHTAEENGNYDALDIADEFSQKANYGGAAAVKVKYEDAGRTRKAKGKDLTHKSLCMWAIEDNPDGYDALFKIQLDRKETFYADHRDLLDGKKATRKDVMEWMLGCIMKVTDGEAVLFTRLSKCEWKVHEKLFPQRSTENYFITEKETNKKKALKSPTRKVHFHDIFLELQQTPEFLRYNSFDKTGFFPYFTDKQKELVAKEIEEKGKAEGGRKPLKYFNKFGGLPITPKPPTERLKIVETHMLEVLCNNNRKFYDYVLDWLAFRMQYPGRKVGSVLVFIGSQGIGKNIFWDWVLEQFFGDQYSHTINDIDRAVEKHNSILDGKLLTMMDEIGMFGTDHKRGAILKSLITGKKQEINPKHVKQYIINDYNAFIMLTNTLWPIQIEAQDRRYPVIECNDAKYGDKAYFKMLAKELDYGMAQEFLQSLLDRDVSNWSSREIPMTDIRREIKENSLPKSIRFMVAFARGRFEEDSKIMKDWCQDGKFTIPSEVLYEEYILWAKDEGETRYQDSKAMFMTYLRNLGLTSEKFRTGINTARGYIFTMPQLQARIKKYMQDDEYVF